MRRQVAGFAVVLAVALASSARADVTLVAATGARAPGATAAASAGQSTTYVKGRRMRTDLVVNGEMRSTVLDLDAGTLVTIDHRARQAEVYQAAALSAGLETISDVHEAMTPTGQTRQFGGESCAGYDLSVSVSAPPDPGDGTADPLTIVLAGPVWVAERSPARADWAAFYAAADISGLSPNADPRTVKVQPVQARGVSAIARRLALSGVPCGQELTISFKGGGARGATLARMGSSAFVSTLESISAAPLDDDLFAVPAGYAVTSRTP
jgi:hypothetical protein